MNGQDGALYEVSATLDLRSAALECDLTLSQSERRAHFSVDARATRFDRAEVGLIAQTLRELLEHPDRALVAANLSTPGVALTITGVT